MKHLLVFILVDALQLYKRIVKTVAVIKSNDQGRDKNNNAK